MGVKTDTQPTFNPPLAGPNKNYHLMNVYSDWFITTLEFAMMPPKVVENFCMNPNALQHPGDRSRNRNEKLPQNLCLA